MSFLLPRLQQGSQDDYNHADEANGEKIHASESSSGTSRSEKQDQNPYSEYASILGKRLQDARANGVKFRNCGVTGENVTIKGFDSSFQFQSTVQDIVFLPLTIYRAVQAKKHHHKRKILSQINFLIKPGEMCLVLGRPGAGCSSFLRTVAGELGNFTDVDGEISYDGIPQKEMIKHFKGDIIYNGEMDVHFPHLTVSQTLEMAIACKEPHSLSDEKIPKKQHIHGNRDLYAGIFHLTHTFNTKVGNDFVRGVSGGERKRVSIAEAMAARGSVYCWDNSSRGLDSSSAYDYIKAIRTVSDLIKSVAFVAIYQAGENIYRKFDKVTVLYDGRQIYYGTINKAKPYFERMGFQSPPRQTTPEFLTAITQRIDSKDATAVKIREEFKDTIPRTAEDFERVWRGSPEYQELIQEIHAYNNRVDSEGTRALYRDSITQQKSKRSRGTSRYTISYLEQIKLCTKRGFQRISGDSTSTVINIAAATIQSLIIGSLYYNLNPSTDSAFSRSGVLYFSLLYYSLMGLANIGVSHRLIVSKHKSYSLYHPSAETLATYISSFPFRLIGLTVFFIIIYFMSNMNRQPGKFFLNYLFLALGAETINALFQMITAFTANLAQANALNGLFLLAMSMYSTYMIQLESMHPWFKWINYLSPLRWMLENMLAVEFHGRRMECTNLVPSGPGYETVTEENQVCAFIGSVPGQPWVSGDKYIRIQYGFRYSYIWRNFGICLGFLCFYVALNTLADEFRKKSGSKGDSLIFKRDAKAPVVVAAIDDEESLNTNNNPLIVTTNSSTKDSNDDVFDGLRSKGVFMWKDVDYVIPYKGSEKKLLDKVSGFVKPGLTALMGASGAGKTTLLNVLAQRMDFGIVSSGEILVDAKPVDRKFKRSVGYVQQQDIHTQELTVRESLQFSARLRRPGSVPDAEKMEYVEKIIVVLGMQDYSDAVVGEAGFGLNVEQRKKLSIGVELVAKPTLLLFLDEPTSGLDSQSSWAILQLLRRLAEAGQAILCTIHQPSATLFESFDRLLLLKDGGSVVYWGNIGDHSKDVTNYFKKYGARECSDTENPAEYMLEVIGAGSSVAKDDWGEVWKQSTEYQDFVGEYDDLYTELLNTNKGDDQDLEKKFAVPYTTQFYYVYRRTVTQLWRDPGYIVSKMMLMISAGLFIGFTFYDVGTSFRGLQNAMFAVFMSIIVAAPLMNQIQSRAIQARELFEARESKSNTFHWSCLLLSQYLSEVPFQIFFSTIYFVAFYFPLKVDNSASRAGVFFLHYCIMFQLYFIGFGLLVLYISPDLPSAAIIMGLSLSFMIGFCGVVQPVRLMPGFWTFMWKVSPFTYFIQSFVSLLLHNKKVECRQDETSYFSPPSGMACGEYSQQFVEANFGYVMNPEDRSNCAYCTYKVGDQYMNTLSFKYSYLWRNFGFYWVYILFNLVGMLVAYYIFHIYNFSPFTRLKQQFMRTKKIED